MAQNTPKENLNYRPKSTNTFVPQLLMGFAGAAVLTVAVVLGVSLWNSNKSKGPADENALASNAVFVVGDASAPKTIDVFEDFWCAHCRDLEKSSADAVNAATASGDLRVRYHFVTFMDDKSPSGDYSTRALGAVMCTVEHDQNVAPALHSKLFTLAPTDDGTDPSNQQLADAAREVGAGDATVACIMNGDGVEKARTRAEESKKILAESNDGAVATPTVLAGGEKVSDLGDGWVTKLTAG